MDTNPVTRLLQIRLLAAADSLRQETLRMAANNEQKILDSIFTALADAEYFAQSGQFQMGWNKIFLVEQQLVLLMNNEQRAIKADNLRIEARKLTGWRQDQIYHLLGHPDADPKTLRVSEKDRIIEAMKIRNDFYNTRNHRMLLRRANLDAVTIALVIILGLLILLTASCPLGDNPRFGTITIIYAILFGALGASFSMAYTISTTDMTVAIPDQLQGIYNIVIRLAVGATAGCVVFMLFISGILNGIFSASLFGAPFFFLVLSFIAGFSERWVVNMLTGIIKTGRK